MYIPRHLEEPIRAASRAYPVVMLCGQRQVGKSTLLRHIAGPERRAVTLDDLSALRLAQNDPALFFETYWTACPYFVSSASRLTATTDFPVPGPPSIKRYKTMPDMTDGLLFCWHRL